MGGSNGRALAGVDALNLQHSVLTMGTNRFLGLMYALSIGWVRRVDAMQRCSPHSGGSAPLPASGMRSFPFVFWSRFRLDCLSASFGVLYDRCETSHKFAGRGGIAEFPAVARSSEHDGGGRASRISRARYSRIDRGKLLNPLGRPAPNSPKYFAAVEIEALARNPDWLSQATKSLAKFWLSKNQKKGPSRFQCFVKERENLNEA